MSLQELGAIGELVGGIAVIFTLAYLALQIRQARKAILANTYQSRTDALGARLLATATNRELLEALNKENRGDVLTDRERSQTRGYWRAVMKEVDNVHFQWQMGVFPIEQLEAVGTSIGERIASDPALLTWWNDIKARERPAFAEWIDKRVQPDE